MNRRNSLCGLIPPMTALFLAACVAFCPAPAAADPPAVAAQPEMPPFSITLAPSRQFGANLERGGKVEATRYLLNADFNQPLSETLGVGLHFAYEFADFRFSAPTAFGGVNPWEKLHRLELGPTLAYDLTPEWSIYISPSVGFSREDDAGWGNALVYGGDLSITRDFGPSLTLGVGIEGFSEVEDAWLLPLIVVNWKINKHLTLSNPSRSGPPGQTGLELACRVGDGWELAAGGSYLSNRFRLNNSGPFRDGIAEISSIPAWARLSRTIGRHFNFDLYAGAMLDGEMSIDDSHGNTIASDTHDPAPFLALSISARF